MKWKRKTKARGKNSKRIRERENTARERGIKAQREGKIAARKRIEKVVERNGKIE